MLKLKLQYFGHLMQRVDSLEKTLMLGGIGGRMRRGRQRTRWLDGITDSMHMSWVNSGSWWWTGRPGMLQFMGSKRVRQDWATDLIWCNIALYSIGPCFYHQSHPQLGILFALAPSLHSFWSYFSTDLQKHIGHLLIWGVSLSVSYHFVFSWGSQGKNTEVVCHSLLQWTTFFQISPPWPAHLGLPQGHGLVSLS